MKKATISKLLATLVVLCLLLTGCGNSGTPTGNEDTTNVGTNAPEASETSTSSSSKRYPLIRYAIPEAPNNLAPWDPYSEAKRFIYTALFESLFNVEGDNFLPLIGKEIKEVDDTHWDVTIFDYVYDSEGNHITADDVVYCYNKFANSGFAVKYGAFGGIEKIDDYTVRFTWTHPITGVGELEHVLGRTLIYSQAADQKHNMSTEPVGTGPYVLKEFVSGSSVKLKARDDYWQTDEQYIHPRQKRNVDEIECVVISEAAQNVVALQTGTIDVSYNITEDALPLFEDGGQYSDKYTLKSAITTSVYLLACDASNGITADANFRRAVYYALDNDKIAEAVGSAYPLKSMNNPNYADAVPQMDNLETYNNTYDPNKAKEYLTKTNYNGETLTLVCRSSEVAKNAATMIQAMLGDVGINIEIKALDNNLYNAAITDPNAYDLIIGDIGGTLMVGSQNRICNNNEYGNGMSFAFVNDPKLDELYDFVNTRENWNAENLTKLYQYITDNAYYNYLFALTKPFVYTKDITDPYIDPSWDFTFMPQGCTYKVK